MSKELDNKYFEPVFIDLPGGIHVYRPRWGSIILFSLEDGRPLAGFCVKPVDCGDDEQTSLITERPDDEEELECQSFQSLFTKGNIKVEFVMTNLTDKGRITFSILKTDKNRNPIMAEVNKVNVIEAGASVPVRADSANDRQLIISMIENSAGEKMTVGEDEQQKNSSGTYFFLKVSPELLPDNIGFSKAFKRTTWRGVQLICLYRKPITGCRSIGPSFSSTSRGGPVTSDGAGTIIGVDEVDAGPRPIAAGTTLFSRGITALGPTRSISGRAQSAVTGLFSRKTPKSVVSGTPTRCFSDKPSGGAPLPPIKPNVDQSSDIVLSSTAVEITHGDVMNTRSSVVDYNFDYVNTSCPCRIGLSVSTLIVFGEKVTNFSKSVQEIVRLNVEQKYVDFLRIKKFSNDECYLCLCEAPNTVFYQCGHKATHYDCVLPRGPTKGLLCGLCRRIVSAFIVVDDDDNPTSVH